MSVSRLSRISVCPRPPGCIARVDDEAWPRHRLPPSLLPEAGQPIRMRSSTSWAWATASLRAGWSI